MAARYDARLAITFLEVASLEALPTQSLHPAIVMRVIRGNLGRRSRPAAATPASAINAQRVFQRGGTGSRQENASK